MIFRFLIIALSLSFFEERQSSRPTLVFLDEFNGDSLNLNTWNYELGNGCPTLCGWGNNEWQEYNKNNVATVNSQLVISATKQGDKYYSGRITTKDKFEFTYGTI